MLTRNRLQKLQQLQNIEADDSGESNDEEEQLESEETSSEESENEESIESETQNNINSLIAKDGSVWKLLANGHVRNGRKRSHNVFTARSGPTYYAKRHIIEGSPISAFRLFVNESMLKIIKNCTETEANRILNSENFQLPIEELESFLGLCFARGIFVSKNTPINYLWSDKWGVNIFKNTMGRDRFKSILRFIRFDIKGSERSKRLEHDKFALASSIWDHLIENCKTCYVPSINLTIDEQLLATKARCRFTQYMPNKPGKFGINFFLLCNARNRYVYNGFPYLGKDEERPENVTVTTCSY